MVIKRIHGFTLLEVLVALAILAVALAALIRTSGDSAENLRYLREKTLAQWVAANLLTDLQVRHRWLATGKEQGKSELAEREWYWTRTVSGTVDDRLREVEITVYAGSTRSHSLVSLKGFLGLSEVEALTY